MHPHRRRQLARLTFAPICQLRGRLHQLGKFTHHVPFGFGFRHFLAELPGMAIPKFAFHLFQHLLLRSLLTMTTAQAASNADLAKNQQSLC
jgi:hypothetical protein